MPITKSGLFEPIETPAQYAWNAILWDDRRSEIVSDLLSQWPGLTEEQAHAHVTAAQQGYLLALEVKNPEVWAELGLTSQADCFSEPIIANAQGVKQRRFHLHVPHGELPLLSCYLSDLEMTEYARAESADGSGWLVCTSTPGDFEHDDDTWNAAQEFGVTICELDEDGSVLGGCPYQV